MQNLSDNLSNFSQEVSLWKKKCSDFLQRRDKLEYHHRFDELHADKGKNAETLLKEIECICSKYNTLLKNIDQAEANQETQKLKDEAAAQKKAITEYQVDLIINCSETNLYHYHQKSKLEFAKKAQKYNQEAYKLVVGFSEINSEKITEINRQASVINDYIRYNEYLPQQAQDILNKVREKEGLDDNSTQFRQAVNLALQSKDYLLFFTLLREQASYYLEFIKDSGDMAKLGTDYVETRRKSLLKIKEIYVQAVSMRLQLSDLPGISPINLIIFNMLLSFKYFVSLILKDIDFSARIHNYDHLDVWLANLKDIYDLYAFCKKVVVSYSTLEKDYSNLKANIDKSVETVSKAKQLIFAQNTKLGEEEKEQRHKEYEDKFPAIINEFPVDKKIRKKKANNFMIDSALITDKDESCEPICSEDDEVLEPHVVSLEELLSSPISQRKEPDFNPNFLLHSLKKAQEENDNLTVIKTNFSLADHFRLEAIHYMKNKSQLSTTIEKMQNVKKYLETALRHLEKFPSLAKNSSELAELKSIHEWAPVILNETKKITRKLLQQQDALYNALEEKRQKAISRLKEEWHKAKRPVGNQISLAAQEYHFHKNAFFKIKKLNSGTEELSIKPLVQKKQFNISLGFLEDRQKSRAIFKGNYAFFSTNNQLQLRRSLSFESFFDPIERDINEYEKQGFGRR